MSLLVCLILLCWYWFVFVPWFDWTWSQVLFTFQIRNLLSSTSHHLFEWKYVAWHRGGWYGGGWFMFCFFGWLSVFCFVFPRWLFLNDSFHIISSSVGKLEVGRGACLTLRRLVVDGLCFVFFGWLIVRVLLFIGGWASFVLCFLGGCFFMIRSTSSSLRV